MERLRFESDSPGRDGEGGEVDKNICAEMQAPAATEGQGKSRGPCVLPTWQRHFTHRRLASEAERVPGKSVLQLKGRIWEVENSTCFIHGI